jgi:two-component system, sensor histidine kinase and response regulator
MTAPERLHMLDLTRRLSEAGDTIQALLAGQIDAVVDPASQTPLLLSKAQTALRASEERYRRIIETTTEGVWLIDSLNRTTFMNRQMARMLGCERDMGMGRSPLEFLDEAGRALFASRAQQQEAHQVEARYIRSDGTSVPALLETSPIFDDSGRYDGLLTMAMDITDRKRGAKELEELSQRTERRERLLTTTLSSISDFAYVFDKAGRFVFANQPLLDLWGITLEEAAGKTFFDLKYPDELAERLHREIQQVFEKPRRLTGEASYTGPTGISATYEYIFSPVLAPNGTSDFVVGSTRDITARKEAEAALRVAKDAAEAGNRAKSEFLTNISHELRTPMIGVLGMTDFVLETELTAEQREHLEIAKGSADALLTIIDDILDFSRIETRGLKLDQIEFSPADAIGAAANAMASKARKKGLNLTVEIGPDFPRILIGDPVRLRQILAYLLDNAVKFTHRGRVVLRVVRGLGISCGGSPLHFSVMDTGIGIPLNRQKSIFEAFTQADGSMTRTYGGTGLGLTIASHLVHLMGGDLWVQSEAGRGSTFHFTACFDPTIPDASLVSSPI